jgi:hypothetical protein
VLAIGVIGMTFFVMVLRKMRRMQLSI